MKKKVLSGMFIVAIFATMFSCVKISDMSMVTSLNHLTIIGTFNPQLGIPVGYATMTADDLMEGQNFSSHSLTATVYSGSIKAYSFDTTWTLTHSFGAKTSMTTDTTFKANIDVDFFSSLDNMMDGVDLQRILVSASARIYPSVSASTQTFLNNYSTVSLTVKQMKAYRKDNSGTEILISQKGEVPYTSSLATDGVDWQLIPDETDVKSWGNTTSIVVEVQLEASVSDLSALAAEIAINDPALAAQIALDPTGWDAQEWVDEHIGLQQITVNANVHAIVPLIADINNMSLTKSVNFSLDSIMGGSSEGSSLANAINFDVDSGYLVIEVVNAMPLDMKMSFSVDSNGSYYLPLLDAPESIPSAKLRALNSYFVAADTSTHAIFVKLNSERFEKVKKATHMEVNVNVSSGTTPYAGGSVPTGSAIALLGTDQMQLRIYVVGKTQLEMDYGMGNTKSLNIK